MLKHGLRFFCGVFFALAVAFACTAHHYKEKSKNQFQTHIPINEAVFKEKLTQAPLQWMMEQIRSDLSAYEKTGISKKLLDEFFQGKQVQALNLIRFTIKDRLLSFSIADNNLDHKQFRHLLAAMKKLNQLIPLPDVDFIVSLQDGFDADLGLPLFVYAKSKMAKSLVLMPDFKALTGYPSLRQKMEKGTQRWPWENKISKAFWRGSTTGGWLTVFNWQQIPRVKLSLLGNSYPEKIDARVTGIVQCDLDIPAIIQSKGLIGKMVAQEDHLKYKYLVDVDGNSCSFERYFWLLLSNSVVLKQITPNIQWYYGALKPYEHFIPVKEDLSDLLEKIEWAEAHDEKSREIAENGTAFIKNELSTEDIFIYMAHLIHEYAKLQIDHCKCYTNHLRY